MASKVSTFSYWFLIFVFIFASGGCSNPGAFRPDSPSASLSEKASCTNSTLTKIETSDEKRPPWTLTEPDDESGKFFLFVGMSTRHSTERDARDEAERNARNEFAKYTGVEVSEVDEMLKSIYGSSSSILDPTISGKNQTKQETNALVSRVKTKNYYFEKYKEQCGENPLGVSYQYWALVKVPKDEYEKVQEWKLKRETAKEAEKALDRTKLGEEMARLATLVIDGGRDSSVFVASDDEGATTEVKAWVWQKKEGQVVPAVGIPLVFKESDGNSVLARARSDANGQALFQVARLKPGNYDVAVNPNGGSTAAMAPPIQGALDSIGATISVKNYTHNLAGGAKAAVRQLFAGPALKPLAVKKIVMGPVSYRGTRMGSEFGKRLETYIVQELSQISDLQVIPPPTTRSLDQLTNASKTRGIGMKGEPLAMSDPAMQAQLDGADGTLEVGYAREGKRVAVDLEIKQSGTGRLLAAAGSSIDQSLIPDNLQVEPPVSRIDSSPLHTGKPGDIHLELTTHRGDGMTFAKGEKIIFYVSSDRDAYLLLLYQDAENHLTQIYPNARSGKALLSAGDFIKIPDESAKFEFNIEPPYGVEQVWAFAATEPFPTLKGTGTSNGLTVLQKGLTEVANQLRAHGKKPGVSYGEANVVLTTVKE